MSHLSMPRICVAVLAASLAVGGVVSASAQTPAPDAKPSKLKLTAEKLRAMKEKWSSNKPKLKSCQKDVKAKGLAGDDRWFYIEDCMGKT